METTKKIQQSTIFNLPREQLGISQKCKETSKLFQTSSYKALKEEIEDANHTSPMAIVITCGIRSDPAEPENHSPLQKSNQIGNQTWT